MQKIDRSVVHAIWSATTGEDLHELVRQAIRLEFATIPPYLTAMLSLAPGHNREVWNTIHAVVIDEMMHMSVACNLLNALGGRPAIGAPGFLPVYPGPLPMAIGDGLVVGLEAYSQDLVRRTFMEIEEPEDPIEIPSAPLAGGPSAVRRAMPTFATIGEFYAALIEKIKRLGDAVFVGDPGRQLRAPQWFGERLVAIGTADEAVRALRVLVKEGEGTPQSPLDPDADFAHYYRFEELWRGRRIKADHTVEEGYSFSGPVVPFDASRVLPLTPNQRLADLAPDSRAERFARHFAFVFDKLINSLQTCFDGTPERFDEAMGLMFELKLVGQRLVQIDAGDSGRKVGPVFTRVHAP